MAIADAAYKFIYCNIGAKGSASDGGIFNLCSFNKKLQDNELNVPQDSPLPDREKPVPYVIVAGDAFALQEHIMKPYSKQKLHCVIKPPRFLFLTAASTFIRIHKFYFFCEIISHRLPCSFGYFRGTV